MTMATRPPWTLLHPGKATEWDGEEPDFLISGLDSLPSYILCVLEHNRSYYASPLLHLPLSQFPHS